MVFNKIKLKKVKFISLLLAAAIAFPGSLASVESANETPEFTYSGVKNATVVLNNIDYTDVKNSNTWAKEAIYETGALDIVKSYGDRQFRIKNTVTKQQAIAIALSAAGREAEARKAGEDLNNLRSSQEKKRDSLEILFDGYLKLAADGGLISEQNLTDALAKTTSNLTPSSFNRSAPATRQEMAYWLAMSLKLKPMQDQKIYNNFRDWSSIDSEKVPYIEAILQNNIMSGDANGRFNPGQLINREQVAQIVKNAEDSILPLLKMEKKTGTVEAVSGFRDMTQGKNVKVDVFNVRNINGKLHHIIVEIPQGTSSTKNEQNGGAVPQTDKDLIVYRDGKIGKSSLLKTGDRIDYIVSPDKSIRYVKVISSVYDTKYIVAQVNSITPSSLTIKVAKLLKLDYPEIDMTKENVSFNTDGQLEEAYRYSSSVAVSVNGRKIDINKLQPGLMVLMTVKNNVVVDIKDIEVGSDGEGGVVKGIVEDNNPQLGYITLFNEDGTTGSLDGVSQGTLLRTYNYTNQNNIDAFKNHKKAKIEDIEPGDTVFLKLDEDMDVISISGVDNYTVKYAKVKSKRAKNIAVEYDNGVQQVLAIDSSVLITSDNAIVKYDRLKDGDRVKLLLHITDKFTKVKEIAIEGDENFITGIYKGKISYINDMSNTLVAEDLQMFDRGRWVRIDHKGLKGIKLSDEYSMFFDNRQVDINNVNKYLKNSEAYIAVQKDYGGAELAAFVSVRSQDDAEVIYDDSVTESVPGSGEFNLSKETDTIKYGEGTIVIKNGRMIAGGSISMDDTAYVVANRSYDSEEFNAGIVQINERSSVEFVQIYRARIKQINKGKDFAVESYSKLNGTSWDFSNTPKTFKLTGDTRIIDDAGIVNQRDFVGYGSNSYVNRTVYIVADNTNALMVNTAPYGVYSAKGEIYDITGMTIGEEGSITQEPTGIALYNARVYNPSSRMWVDSKDMTLKILTNSIIIKDKKIAKPSDLKKGDRVRIIKKDEKDTGDAYIIMVEE
ncbi:MAG: S-layer homology domain-containing protein [Clostridia bacterium]|nr:S-layer homology domain-containing protein [Clostridia bacterium]